MTVCLSTFFGVQLSPIYDKSIIAATINELVKLLLQADREQNATMQPQSSPDAPCKGHLGFIRLLQLHITYGLF